MSGVVLQKVVKRFGEAQVIHGVDLTIEDGDLTPSLKLRDRRASS